MQRGILRQRLRRGRQLLRRRLVDDTDTAREHDPDGESLISHIADELDDQRFNTLGFERNQGFHAKTEAMKECCVDSSKLDQAAEAYHREQKETIEFYRKLVAETENGNKSAFATLGISKAELLNRYSNWIQRNEKEIDEGHAERILLQAKITDLAKQVEKLQQTIQLSEELLKNLNSK